MGPGSWFLLSIPQWSLLLIREQTANTNYVADTLPDADDIDKPAQSPSRSVRVCVCVCVFLGVKTISVILAYGAIVLYLFCFVLQTKLNFYI